MTRTLPIRVPPLPGEALDSWLAAIACRMQVTWGELFSAIVPPGVTAHWAIGFSRYLDDKLLDAIAQAGAVEPAQVAAMTLQALDGRLLTICRGVGDHVRSPWGRVTTSRFCPYCLADTAGRWQLNWCLPWVFCCTVHRCLLAETCPDCGQRQRVIPSWFPSWAYPDALRCRGSGRGSDRAGCGVALVCARPAVAPVSDHLLEAQYQLHEILSTPQVDFGIYRQDPASSLAFLHDLHGLVVRICTVLTPDELHETTGVNPTRWPRFQISTFPGRRGSDIPAAMTGTAVARALPLLAWRSIPQAAQAYSEILDRGRAAGQMISVGRVRVKGASAVFDAVCLTSLAPAMTPFGQLLYRTPAALPRYPQTHPDPRNIDSQLPTLIWQDWSFRLARGNWRDPDVRAAISALVNYAACEHNWSPHPHGGSVSQRGILQITQQPQWPTIALAIIRLADYLAARPSPIDYERRRRLDYTELLPNHEWFEICSGSEQYVNERTTRYGRAWVYERITGTPASMPRFGLAPARFTAGAQAQAALRAAVIDPRIVAGLDRAAMEFLDRRGLGHEPLTWSPPRQLVADLELPGPDQDLVDRHELQCLLRANDWKIDPTAAKLEIPADLVAYLLESSALSQPSSEVHAGSARGRPIP